jgi:glycosyltransferase involved in cell wall biosynthesis
LKIALDATYSVGDNLSGVGVYSRELLHELASAHSEQRFEFCYRPHRYLRSFGAGLPLNCSRALLYEPWFPRSRDFFHGLNQRLPGIRFRKTVSTFHDLFVLTGDYSTPEFRRRFAAQAREAAKESDLIVCVSSFTASQVEQLLGVERARLRVIHHGVHLPAAADGARERIILHVGAIQKRKNVARLVDAFRAVGSDWRLVLAGSAGFGAEEILAGIQGRDRVTVTGYISREKLAQWYRRALVLAFPSLDEGFGMPVLEAMASGVAVVTSNRSALPEVAGDAAMLVDPENTDEIEQALVQVTTNEALRDSLVRRGYERAAQFSWPGTVQRTWEVYRELLW